MLFKISLLTSSKDLNVKQLVVCKLRVDEEHDFLAKHTININKSEMKQTEEKCRVLFINFLSV